MRYQRLAALGQLASTVRVALNIGRPRHSLFLVSHMRSFSSLVCHILNSNPEIDGYGELGIDYRTPLDLVSMRHAVALSIDQPLRGRFVLDKLLHQNVGIADSVLQARSTRVMLTVREPEASVRSIIAMGLRRKNPDWKAQPNRAAQHYINRLDTCVAIAEARRDVLVFPADAIVDDTERFLAGLTDWLGLRTPLRPDYEVGKMTGKGGFGDTSGQILAGTVNPDRPRNDVELPPDVVESIWAHYDRTLDALFKLSTDVLCAESRAARDRTAT